jgi:hypothetical protein
VADWCQVLVDEVVRGETAARDEGERLERWLVDTGVLSPDLTDCVYGHPLGHPPGPSYDRAIAGAEDPPRLWMNGGYVVIGRRAHGGGGLEELACRQCGRPEDVTAGGERWQRTFMSTIAEWADGGDGTVTCLGCGARNELSDWDWRPRPWGFGEVALVLWNWAPLAPRFIDGVAAVLGHPVRYLDYAV